MAFVAGNRIRNTKRNECHGILAFELKKCSHEMLKMIGICLHTPNIMNTITMRRIKAQKHSYSHTLAHSCIQQEEYCLYVLKRSWTRTKLQTKMEFITNSWYGEQFMWIQKRNIETETYGTWFQFNVNNECFDKYADFLDFTARRSYIASAFRFFSIWRQYAQILNNSGGVCESS